MLARLLMIGGVTAALGGCGRPLDSAALRALQARAADVETFTFASMTAVPANVPPAVNETVADPAKARDAYNATLALPLMPSGTYNCPAEFGVTYQLIFSGQGAPIMTATVDPNGCQQVQVTDGGLNSALLWSVKDGEYWVTLAADLGVKINEIYPYFPPASSP